MWVIMDVDGPIEWDPVPATCSELTNQDSDCIIFPESTRIQRPDPDYDSINVNESSCNYNWTSYTGWPKKYGTLTIAVNIIIH